MTFVYSMIALVAYLGLVLFIAKFCGFNRLGDDE